MRIATATAVLAGAVSASSILGQAPQEGQHVLSDVHDSIRTVADAIGSGAGGLDEALRGASSEVKALWEDLKMLVPGAVGNLSFLSQPKKHTRRPDSHWDYVVKGRRRAEDVGAGHRGRTPQGGRPSGIVQPARQEGRPGQARRRLGQAVQRLSGRRGQRQAPVLL